jgi:hypothetical protein
MSLLFLSKKYIKKQKDILYFSKLSKDVPALRGVSAADMCRSVINYFVEKV